MPEPGDRAPDFSLPSTEGELRLSDSLQQGRVLLAFYFEDATPTCSTEIEALKDAHETLRELGASVIAVSADSLDSHRAFAERLGGLPFALASDPDLTVGRASVVIEDVRRFDRRGLGTTWILGLPPGSSAGTLTPRAGLCVTTPHRTP